MNLDRAELLKTIETIKPALATRDLIPELQHVWLDGETVTAYNDTDLGIQSPFKSALKGGLRGTVLLGVLANSRAKEVTIEFPDEGYALIKAGRTRLKLALLPQERAVWELPKVDTAKGFNASTGFLGALKAVLLSVGAASNQVPEQMGITMVAEKGSLQLYTTDSKSISWATVKESNWPLKERVTLPTAFAEQLLKQADDKTKLFVTQNGVLAVTGAGVKIFARLIEVPKPNDFQNIINDSMKGIQLFTIPKRLKLALERASIMLNNKEDEPMQVGIVDGLMKLHVDTPHGELDDSIRLEEIPKPMEIRLNPILMKRGLAICQNIGMSSDVAIMSGDNFLYLIAGFG